MTWNNRRRRTLGAFAKEQSGAAAVEMAIWLFILVVPLMNIIDLGLYVFQNMEVENAAQMAAQSAWAECGQQLQPASTKCPGFATALQRGARSTTLASSISVGSTEDEYCVNADGDLEKSCTPSAYYLVVTTTYNYAPMFAPVSVASLFPSPIVRTTWRRMS
jgi:Flp pilus assembly protein TadG